MDGVATDSRTERRTDALPPQDLRAEQATLGCCMLHPKALATATERLLPRDFYRQAHQVIYKACLDLERRGVPVDIVTVGGELHRIGALDAVGGAEYLTVLLHEVATTTHVRAYVDAVLRCSVSRNVIATTVHLQERAYDAAADPIAVISEGMGRLERIQERCDAADAPLLVGHRVGEWDDIEKRRLRPYEVSLQRFGIPDLDRRTGGLEDAGFTIVMGDTNTGKSSLLRQIVLSTAIETMVTQDPGVVVIYAMEESGWRWRLRSSGWVGCFDTRAFDNAAAWQRALIRNPEIEQQYITAIQVFDQLPIMLASGDQTMDSIEASCRRIARTRPIRLVALDYLQRIGKDEDMYGTEERAWRDISRRICRLRDSLQCPVIGPSQISKAPDGQHITFGARAFQHDADLVMEIHRAKTDDGKWQGECHLESHKTREIASWGKFACVTDFPTGRWYAEEQEHKE